MTVTFEVSNSDEIEQLFSYFKIAKIDNVQVVADLKPKIQKGNKDLDPKGLFGIWRDNPKNIEDIRNDAWQRK